MSSKTDQVLEAHAPLPGAPLTVVQALSAVMGDVQAVGKDSYNQAQRFNFRGIDAVVNAVGPALRRHGVLVMPSLLDMTLREITTAKGSQMQEATVRVRYTFYGPAGDCLECDAPGSAFDSGDKAIPKAMSVAFRVALLQALCIPTDEPDVDSESHERGSRPPTSLPPVGGNRRPEPVPDQAGPNWTPEQRSKANGNLARRGKEVFGQDDIGAGAFYYWLGTQHRFPADAEKNRASIVLASNHQVLIALQEVNKLTEGQVSTYRQTIEATAA